MTLNKGGDTRDQNRIQQRASKARTGETRNKETAKKLRQTWQNKEIHNKTRKYKTKDMKNRTKYIQKKNLKLWRLPRRETFSAS